MATAVLYCEVRRFHVVCWLDPLYTDRRLNAIYIKQEPTRGGATAFPGIDIMIQGRKGQALLFHYAGDADAAPPDIAGWRAGGVVDNGYAASVCLCANSFSSNDFIPPTG